MKAYFALPSFVLASLSQLETTDMMEEGPRPSNTKYIGYLEDTEFIQLTKEPTNLNLYSNRAVFKSVDLANVGWEWP